LIAGNVVDVLVLAMLAVVAISGVFRAVASQL
jgi:hypothetical protein